MNSLSRKFMSVIISVSLVSGVAWTLKARPLFAQQICPLDTLKPVKVKSLEALKRIPVLNQGRIKPFETYAQNFLLQISGRKHYQKENATEWMAKFLFAPRTTFNDKVFLVNHPEILEALNIEPAKNRRYSFHQLDSGYDKLKELADVVQKIDEKNQSIVHKELLRVYSNLGLYIRLSGAFTFAVPHPDFTFSPETLKQLQLPEKQARVSFYDILGRSENLKPVAENLEKKDPGQWSETEKEVGRLLNAIAFWSEHYAGCPIGLIPTQGHEDDEWISPMDTILVGFFDPVYREEVKNLRDMAVNYWSGGQLEFDTSARAFNSSILKRISPKEEKAAVKIPLELLYNQWNLLLWAKLFYAIGFLFFLFSLLSEKTWMRPTTFTFTILGFVPHVLALVLRVMIMSRPPVSNLFETFIFVGAVCAALGIILEVINKNWLGVVVANTGGLILLLVAGKFGADGDTMQMLVAVLNSNFWLSTHVIAITTGYAGCCVAGIMGHIYILQALSQPHNKKRLEVTCHNMLGILGFGLTMSFLGTTLGGIWADQSWGRFWGWDPKENGALMIVLWSAIVFHARIAKIINPLGVAVGCILGLINVIWAWFGVNLLSVGLHSYGFTSGIANALAIYVLIEVIFISIAVLILGKKNFNF